jgi:hypothetical protein
MDEYRNVTLRPVPLASGRVLAPNETAALTALDGDADSVDPQDQALVDDGVLVQAEQDPEPTREATRRRNPKKETAR